MSSRFRCEARPLRFLVLLPFLFNRLVRQKFIYIRVERFLDRCYRKYIQILMLANFIFTNIIFSKRFKASNFRLRQRNDSVRGSKRKIKRKRERGKKRNDENKIESTRTIYARVFFLRSSVKVLRQSSWSKGYIKSSGGNVRKVLGLFFADKQLPRDILWQFESRKKGELNTEEVFRKVGRGRGAEREREKSVVG